jgi:hypothetical protein
VGRRDVTKLHPYAVLGAVLADELDAMPPRVSRKRKRLREAMRARLGAAFLGPESSRPAADEDPAAA